MPWPVCRESPCVDATTRSGSFGSMTILLIFVVSSRPMCVHVLPASIDLYMPSPDEPCTESPVPAYTMLGSDGATWIAPMLSTFVNLSKIGNHDTPALVVFQMPPAGAPR